MKISSTKSKKYANPLQSKSTQNNKTSSKSSNNNIFNNNNKSSIKNPKSKLNSNTLFNSPNMLHNLKSPIKKNSKEPSARKNKNHKPHLNPDCPKRNRMIKDCPLLKTLSKLYHLKDLLNTFNQILLNFLSVLSQCYQMKSFVLKTIHPELSSI